MHRRAAFQEGVASIDRIPGGLYGTRSQCRRTSTTRRRETDLKSAEELRTNGIQDPLGLPLGTRSGAGGLRRQSGAARRLTIGAVSTIEERNEEPCLHLFTVGDPRLWEFRSQLLDEEFAIPDVSDEEWEAFHAIIAEG